MTGFHLVATSVGHVQGRSDHRSAAPDGALAAQRTTVAVVGRHPDQGRELLGRQGPQFRQLGQHRAAEARPHARHALQQVVLFSPHGTVANRGVEIGIHPTELTGQPLDVRRDPLAERRASLAQPVLLGGEHLDQLPPSRQHGAQGLSGLIRQWARRGAQHFPELGQDLRIERIRLGQPPGGTGKFPDLAGVDDMHRQARRPPRR